VYLEADEFGIFFFQNKGEWLMTTSIGIIYARAELVCQALDRLWAELSVCAVEIMLQDGDGGAMAMETYGGGAYPVLT